MIELAFLGHPLIFSASSVFSPVTEVGLTSESVSEEGLAGSREPTARSCLEPFVVYDGQCGVVARTCTWFCGALPQYIPVPQTVLQLLALQHIQALRIQSRIRVLRIQSRIQVLRIRALRIQSHILALDIRVLRIRALHIQAPLHIRALRIRVLRIRALHIQAPLHIRALRIQSRILALRILALRIQSRIRALRMRALHILAPLHIRALRGIRPSHNIRNIHHLRDCHQHRRPPAAHRLSGDRSVPSLAKFHSRATRRP
jgi:hypothetical protein